MSNESKIAVVERAITEEKKLLEAIEVRQKLDVQSVANLQDNITKGEKLLEQLKKADLTSQLAGAGAKDNASLE